MPRDLEMTIVAGADLAEAFSRSAGEARAAMRRELAAAQFAVVSKIKSNLRHRSRSGALAESFIVEPLTESGNLISGRAGSNLEYAAIQEAGGEVQAKSVPHLTIPLAPFLTGRRIARGTARSVIESPGAYGYDGTFFSRGVLFGKRGEESEPLFALKESITIPARPYVQPALDEAAPEFEAAMRAALEALL